MIDEVVYSNFILVVGLIVILFIMQLNPLYDKNKNRLFQISALINLFLLIVISLDSLFAYSLMDGIFIARRITSFINFSFAPFLPIVLYLISTKKKPKWWFYVPSFFSFLISFLSMFWPIVFSISPKNSYDRGPLFIFPFSICLFYLVFLIIHTINHKKQYRKNEVLFLIFSISLFLFCFYLEIGHKYKFLTWDASALCTILYYLLLNANNSGMDPLTQVQNRLAYTKMLDKIKGPTNCAIGLIDINDFKKVNDTYGHSAGDEFLKKFAGIFQKNISNKVNFFRIGGDEFAIISRSCNKEELLRILENITEVLKKENMFFSFGVAEYNSSTSLDDTLYLADKEMYKYKKIMRENKKL